MDNKIGFSYGMLGDPLEEQANKQGFTLGNKAELYDRVRESINMCKFHVATESQTTAMFNKLHKKVINALKPLEN